MKYLALFFTFTTFALAAKLPANQEKCAPGNSNCLLKVANEIISKGKTGYAEIGLPVLDPLRIEKLNIEQGGESPVNLKIYLKNVDMSGLSDVKFNKIEGFSANYDKEKTEFRFRYPVLNIYGPYKMEGRVLVLPVQGNGIMNLTMYDNDIVYKVQTKKVVKNGKDYIQIDKSKLDFVTPSLTVHFGNLFNGNKELGETTNRFFNENWKDILKEIKPAISESIAAVYQALINNVLSNIPQEELFAV